MTITMTSLAWSLWITFFIGWLVREGHRAIGQRISRQANMGLAILGLVAMVSLFASYR